MLVEWADDGRVDDAERLTEALGLLAVGRWERAHQQLADLLADQESPEAHDGMGSRMRVEGIAANPSGRQELYKLKA